MGCVTGNSGKEVSLCRLYEFTHAEANPATALIAHRTPGLCSPYRNDKQALDTACMHSLQTLCWAQHICHDLDVHMTLVSQLCATKEPRQRMPAGYSLQGSRDAESQGIDAALKVQPLR